MASTDLKQSISELAIVPAGRVGVCAETIGGRHRIEINADNVYPAASSIKMYLPFTLLVQAEAGRLSLNERIEFTPEAAKPGSGVMFHLEPGLRPTLRDLATLMMLTNHLGADTINATIDRLVLEHTRYGDWSRFEVTYADSMLFGQATPREFGFPETVWVASKSGLLDDCVTESGCIQVKNGGWAIIIMIRDLPEIASNPAVGENLVSTISQRICQAWAPQFDEGEST